MTVAVTINATKANQLANQAGRGNISATGKMLKLLFDADVALQSNMNLGAGNVKVGSCGGSTSSISVVVQSGFTPEAVIVFAKLGSAIWAIVPQIADGDAMYIRGNASVPSSMGLLGSQGIYLQSNGFSLGSKITLAAANSFGYIALKSGT